LSQFLKTFLILLLCVECLPFLYHCSHLIGLIFCNLCCRLNCWMQICWLLL
jgi:hypothetical protein